MTLLIRSLLAASTLAIAITAQASHHVSAGLQVGAGSAYGEHSSSLLAVNDGFPDEQENYHTGTDTLIGLYGVNLGYHWGMGTDTFAARLSANLSTGDSTHTSITDDELRGVSGDDAVVISEKVKFKQQYNLSLEWHHQLGSHFEFLAGVGISALKIESNLSTDESVTAGYYDEIRLSQHKTLLGPALSTGIEYAMNTNNHLRVAASYSMYHSTHFADTGDINTSDAEWTIINRRGKLNLFAFTVGYSHQF